jgi:hypothetical protein
MRVRALVAAAAVALIVPAVPAFATETPSPTTDPTPTASADPTATSDPTATADPTTDPTATDPTATADPTTTETPTPTPPTTTEPAPTVNVGVDIDDVVRRTGASLSARVVAYDRPSSAIDVVWQWWDESSSLLVGEPSQPVALVTDAQSQASLTVVAPSGADGRYRLHVDVTATEDGATGSAISAGALSLDNTAPAFFWSRNLTTFYPAKDGYRDTFSVTIKGGWELSRYNVQVLNSAGTSVWTMGSGELTWSGSSDLLYYAKPTWNGLDRSGARVPAGTYTVKATLTDDAGNRTTKTTTVGVSWKKLVWKTFSKKLTAGAALADKYVGSCSTLKAPARSDWAGSRGYRSNVKCQGGDTAKSRVITDSVACLPRSFDGNYRNLTMKHYGGRPKGYTKNVYLVTHVYKPQTSGDWTLTQRHQFGNSVQWKTMASVSTPNGLIADRRSTQYCPSIWWVSGLQSSSRYDVWKYSVASEYRVLA